MSDAFGLRSLGIDQARARPGAKWQFHTARYAAWVADMDFPIAPAIRDRLIELAATDVGYPPWGGTRGTSPAVSAFVERMLSRYDWAPQPAWLFELSDVVQGVRVAVHHLTEPGDRWCSTRLPTTRSSTRSNRCDDGSCESRHRSTTSSSTPRSLVNRRG